MSRRIGICGLGLIGSSVARALVSAHEVVGLDPDESAVATVGALGVGVARTWSDLEQCELVVLAAPTAVNEELLQRLIAQGPRVPVADLGSVKTRIEQVWRTDPSFPFVGTHPMAGSERSGANAGAADLFQGSAWPVVVTMDTDPDALLLVLEVILEMGGQPVPMTAAGHDRAVALASHLPHLLSGALGAVVAASPDTDLAVGLAAGSFRDVSRISGSPPRRTAEFVTENGANAAVAARAAAAALRRAADLLDEGLLDDVAAWLAPGHDVRSQFEGQRHVATTDTGPLSPEGVRAALVGWRDSGARVVGVTRNPAGVELGVAEPGRAP